MKQDWLSHYHSKTKLNRYRYDHLLLEIEDMRKHWWCIIVSTCPTKS